MRAAIGSCDDEYGALLNGNRSGGGRLIKEEEEEEEREDGENSGLADFRI